jgi:hypothetical protein
MTNNAVNPSAEILKQHKAAESCMLCRKEFESPKPPKKFKNADSAFDAMDWEDDDMPRKKKVIKTFHHNHHTGTHFKRDVLMLEFYNCCNY